MGADTDCTGSGVTGPAAQRLLLPPSMARESGAFRHPHPGTSDRHLLVPAPTRTAQRYWLFQKIAMIQSFLQTAYFPPNCLPSINSSAIPKHGDTDKTRCISIYMKGLGNSIMLLLFYCRWHINFSLLLQKTQEPCRVQ